MRPVAGKPLLGAALSTLAVVAVCAACSSSSSQGGGSGDGGAPGGEGAGCVINTDCNDPLVCKLQHCHAQCVAARDCTGGERCVLVDGNGVCELPTESSCASGATCISPLVCGPDMQCRAACDGGGVGCATGQVCTGGLCYDQGGADAGSGSAASSD